MKNPSGRKAIASALLAAGSLIAASAALKYLDLGATLRILTALLPLPAYAWFLLVQIGSARRLDELQQRVHLEALVFAFPTTFMGILTTWLLYVAGPLANLSFSNAIAFFLVLMIFLYPVGLFLAARRYR
ncbi:MAG: hypothetical protein ACRD5I_12430 [Candidatus Acidiferrales bacterium]